MTRLGWIRVIGIALAAGLAGCQAQKTSGPPEEVASPTAAGHAIRKISDCLTIPDLKLSVPRRQPLKDSAERSICDLDAATCAAWRRFREDHPVPYQGFAGERLNDGRAVLVLSEPPPDMSQGEAANIVKAAFGDRAPEVSVARWMIGADGYVEDLVVSFAVPGLADADLLSDQDLRDRLALLQQAWFGTSCGGDVEVIGEGAASRDISAPNLRVTSRELVGWMKNPNLLWARIEDEAPLGYTWNEIAEDQALGGAFLSVDHSLALFSFDPGALGEPDKMAKLKADFRRFAVSSDAIVGVVGANGGRIGLVGRGRTHSLSEIPPLRFETFALLAAQHADQLQQSYERTNPFAGKMSNLRDWAPIYLSPPLVDTEFGALLNITDQMLKSWSEAGTVNYADFNYPRKPNHFPFGQPLSELVYEKTGSPETLFNWNTSGSAVVVHDGDLAVLTGRQLGALPVTYGSELHGGGPMKTGHLLGYEDTAYDYFAGLKDANLARVVQYTLIYQGMRNLAPSDPGETQPGAATTPQSRYLAQRMRIFLDGLSSPSPAKADEDRQAQTALRNFVQRHPDISVEQISAMLVDRSAMQGLSFSSNTAADQFGTDWSDLEHAISVAIRAREDLAQVREGFEKAALRPISGWIHTPSLVVSWGSGLRALLSVGGHNLVAHALSIEMSSDIQGVRLMDDGKIAYGADQTEAVEGHAAELARAVEHKNANQSDIDHIMGTAPSPPRPLLVALDRSTEAPRPGVARLGGRTFETAGAIADTVKVLKAKNPCCRFLLEGEDGQFYMGEANPMPPPTEIAVRFGDTASIGPYLRRHPGAPPLDLIVFDANRAHVDAMLAGWDMQGAGAGSRGWLERLRSAVFGSNQSSDHLISSDLKGRAGAISIKNPTGNVRDRAASLERLRSPVMSPARALELDPDSVDRLLAPLLWDTRRDGRPIAVRANFGGDNGSHIDVVAGSSGSDPGTARVFLGIVDRDLSDAAHRQASLAQAMISIENDLRQLPDQQFRRVAMRVRQGTAEIQTTMRAPVDRGIRMV